MRSLRLLLVIPALLLAPCHGQAAIWHVPGDAATIEEALQAAWSGDEILVACGTYYEADLVLKSGVILRSEGGEASCVTIDAQGEGRVFYIGPDVLVPVVEGFTVTGGAAGIGGGAYVGENASVLFKECVFEGNSAIWSGGGVFCANTHGLTVHLYSAALFGNSAGEGGGALYSGRSTVRLTNCTLSHNSAAVRGGGVCSVADSHLTLENTIISFSLDGEAMYSDGTCPLVLSCCDVYGNAGGDWVGCISGMVEFEGNQWADPLFCDATSGDFALEATSPCAPDSSPPGCGLIGTYGVGCSPSTLAVESETGMTLTPHLRPAAPNPFGCSTEILYGIPAGVTVSRVGMKVYDATGREVRTLVDTDQGPGEYRAVWDGRDDKGARVASGVYFCTLVWQGRSETRRVVLLR